MLVASFAFIPWDKKRDNNIFVIISINRISNWDMAIIPSAYFILEIKINKYNRIPKYIAFYHSSLDRQTIIFKYFIMNCLVWLLLPAFFNSLASGTTLSKSGKFTISGTYTFFIELRLLLKLFINHVHNFHGKNFRPVRRVRAWGKGLCTLSERLFVNNYGYWMWKSSELFRYDF